MDDKRLKYWESMARNFHTLGVDAAEELIAEVRRLRVIVDRLLDQQPIDNDRETGVYCGYCKTMIGYCEPGRCAFEYAVNARDWEVGDD